MTSSNRSRRVFRLRARGATMAAFGLLLLCAQVLAAGSNLPPIPAGAVASIRAEMLRKHLEFLASDELGGRYTLSTGNKIAARYLAAQLQSFGFRGAVAHPARPEDAFFQKIGFNLISLDAGKSTLTLNAGGKSSTFAGGSGFRAFQATNSRVTGELIFVRYGIVTADQSLNEYQGLDVKGKIVVTVQGVPPSVTARRVAFREFGAFPAAERGALAVLVLPNVQTTENWPKTSVEPEPERVEVAQGETGKPRLPIPLLTLSPSAAEAVLADSGTTLGELQSPGTGKAAPWVTLKPMNASVKLETKVRQAESQNVVGILEGTDPRLKDEFVAISAHYDHVEGRDGVVYNGADDDGSGTVAVLEMARAFSMVKPKRSILAIFHTGEEMGLIGSKYFTDTEPLVPLKSIVADLNIDMIGRSRRPEDKDSRNQELTDRQSVYVIGSGRISGQLREINDQTTAELGQLKLDYSYEDEDAHSYYTRSDHYHYAKHGIPIAFFFTGEHEDYHMPTDDVEKIDFEKMTRITQMIYATAWRVANLDQRLKIDKPAEN